MSRNESLRLAKIVPDVSENWQDKLCSATFSGSGAPRYRRNRTWTKRFAAVVRKPDSLEAVVSLFVGKAQHVRQTERPAFVLRGSAAAICCLKRPVSAIYGRSGPLATGISVVYSVILSHLACEECMAAFAKNEAEIADRASRFLKAELKRAGLTYDDLSERLGSMA